MKTMIALSAIFVTISASAAGPVKTISHSTMSYPGPTPEFLLASMANSRWLASTPEGRKACPQGIARILKIKAEAKVIGTEVNGYPEASVEAVVECR